MSEHKGLKSEIGSELELDFLKEYLGGAHILLNFSVLTIALILQFFSHYLKYFDISNYYFQREKQAFQKNFQNYLV